MTSSEITTATGEVRERIDFEYFTKESFSKLVKIIYT
jgi:hypothetical protein